MVVIEAQFSAWDGERECRGKCSGSCPQGPDDLQTGQDNTSMGSPSQPHQELKTGPGPALLCPLAWPHTQLVLKKK